MRESLGGAMLLNLVVIFTGLVIVFFIGILSYSKAYRVKNRIIEIIEKHEKYDENVADEINPDLRNAGYNASSPTKCDGASVQNHLEQMLHSEYVGNLPSNKNAQYDYCVFEINSTDYPKNISEGKYYVVVTFIRFEIPIIGDVLTFPVYGETKILNKNYNY